MSCASAGICCVWVGFACAVSDAPERSVPGAEDEAFREELNVIDDSLRGKYADAVQATAMKNP